MRTSKLNRRKFLYTGAASLVGMSAVGLGGYSESNHPRLVKIDIPLSRLPESFDGFTIAQLSDFHYEEQFSAVPIRKAIEVVNALKPDLIALTGDFVTIPVFKNRASLKESLKMAAPCAQALSSLHAPMGKFAVLGNHDGEAGPAHVTAALAANQIPVLSNQSLPLERGKDRIWLAGIDDALRGYPDLGAAIKRIPSGETTILLAHEPDFADDSSLSPIDLQLSGHSHGGQIWIPGIGAPWLPPLARKFPRGLYRIGNLTLYTNIGIGTIRAPIRLNCPPEITLITLRASRR